MLFYRLKKYQPTALPLAAWLEQPSRLYQVLHVHDCYEIVLVQAGTGWCAVNGQRFPMLRGDLYVCRPGDRHEFTNDPGTKFYNLMFTSELFSEEESEVFRPLLRWTGKYTLPSAAFERINLLLADLCVELKNLRPGNIVAAKASFLRILVELLRIPLKRNIIPGKDKDSGLVARILDLIARRCGEKLTLNDLARALGCSPEYAGRRFKKLTGITFLNYLTRYRIDLACGLLENTSDPISEIALKLGYFDNASFDKCFRKVLGMSPRKFRQNLAVIQHDHSRARKR